MNWPLGSLGLTGDFELRIILRQQQKYIREELALAEYLLQKKKKDRQDCLSYRRRVGLGPSVLLLLGLKTFSSYAAPIALRCWKHSRQNTSRPCVGRKGTVVSFPHCEQLVLVSERIGEAWPPPPPPPSARFALQALQRFGSF